MNSKQASWTRRRFGWTTTLTTLMAIGLISACGGGGGSSTGDGVTAASTFTVGAVRGFGSIIVNGVRFDDSGAEIENEDGARGSSDDIRLGSMVEVESGRIDDSTGRATAVRIRFGSEIKGPVASVDPAANSFVVLGQVIEVKAETVFDDSLGASGVAGLAGKVVEVHAQRDAATGHYVATRIEAENAATSFKVNGTISALDTTAKTFRIGDALISYATLNAADMPAGLADGMKVRVRMAIDQVNGTWVATGIRGGDRRVDDHDDARLQGNVTAYTSATQFEVNGIPVDASAARIDKGPVNAGSIVEVRGSARNGTLVAERVKVLDGSDDSISGVELHGDVSGVDGTTKTFMLRGVKVAYGGSVSYERGSEAQVVDGARVEVKGTLSDDRSTLTAASIKFED
ncbi:DUF5666 domain-containing protein [Variovorax sp. YR752]|uniref:DUF5666 domain-containing protein n=1 Tax=Variovorax sp. YR752 TaxID=1884383 RepID=UPI0031383134